MKNKTGRASAELCGAVIGAGFASGKELAAFFSRFGVWSWLGVAAAVLLMGWLSLGLMWHPGEAGMPLVWKEKPWGKVWRGMFTALLTATAGAMLAAGGEVAALLLPFQGARLLGLAGMMLLGWYLTAKETLLLAGISRGLIICLVAVVVAGIFLPAQEAVDLHGSSGAEGVLWGLCYGGFNTALAAPVIAETGKQLDARQQRSCVLRFTGVLAVLLLCGNAVLLRHTALQGAELPFVMLLEPLGRVGYVLGGGALGLAALTTLAACMKGLRALVQGHMGMAVAAVLVLSISGLEGIVGMVYPLLGAGCLLLLTAARLQIGTKM